MVWLVTGAALVGTVANIRHKRWGFAVWLATNGLLALHNASIGEYAQATLFAVYTGLAVWGWLAWGKSDKRKVH